MELKQAHEMTNKELFEELKSRGFYVLKNTANDDENNINCMLVSVTEPTQNVRMRYVKDTDKLTMIIDGYFDYPNSSTHYPK